MCWCLLSQKSEHGKYSGATNKKIRIVYIEPSVGNADVLYSHIEPVTVAMKTKQMAACVCDAQRTTQRAKGSARGHKYADKTDENNTNTHTHTLIIAVHIFWNA